ncbi:hypothetical protein KJ855_00250 [Patescibacteria group bacterium]|nr:hypothetical protein [Patescibacteria group bacterium]
MQPQPNENFGANIQNGSPVGLIDYAFDITLHEGRKISTIPIFNNAPEFINDPEVRDKALETIDFILIHSQATEQRSELFDENRAVNLLDIAKLFEIDVEELETYRKRLNIDLGNIKYEIGQIIRETDINDKVDILVTVLGLIDYFDLDTGHVEGINESFYHNIRQMKRKDIAEALQKKNFIPRAIIRFSMNGNFAKASKDILNQDPGMVVLHYLQKAAELHKYQGLGYIKIKKLIYDIKKIKDQEEIRRREEIMVSLAELEKQINKLQLEWQDWEDKVEWKRKKIDINEKYNFDGESKYI